MIEPDTIMPDNTTNHFFRIRIPGQLLTGLLGLCLLFLPGSLWALQVTLNIADVAAPGFSARGIKAVLAQNGSAEFSIAELGFADRTLHGLHLHCAEFLLSTEQIGCLNGKLDSLPGLSVFLNYRVKPQRLELRLTGKKDESWQLNADLRAQPWHASVRLRNARIIRLSGLLPPDGPLPSQGGLNGTLAIKGDQQGVRQFNADLQLDDWAVSDASGLHAAEKIHGKLQAQATRTGRIWDWSGTIDWQDGELFWQPLYLRAGHALQASGKWQDGQIQATQAVATLPDVGQVKLSALWDISNSKLLDGRLSGKQLSLAAGFANYARPFLENTALAKTELKGHADLEWRYRKNATEALLFKLRNVSVADAEGRFSLNGINADIPWHARARSVAQVSFADSELMKLPLGASKLKIQMQGKDFVMPAASLPVLDGKLEITDFHLHQKDGNWQWNFSNTLTPISMDKLSAVLYWPQMHGTLSGYVPRVSYQDKLIRADGTLLFRVFDGTAEVDHLELYDPFGRAPRLSGNLDMRDLDLDLLTNTFSFGNIQGRIDLSVGNLELVNWRPARFDARVASSPGKYRKRISQKAVENITALGGSGAGAALQRSFLRIFESFGYERIGLGCELHNEICTMSGVDGEGEIYTIVQGGGIPAITVMGYNRKVDWTELLSRLERVMQENMQAVVK
ncbi:hypothetical protein [Candidatus Nitrotoga fabula]|uniref:Dicarboxylate transport domain-containing protein n=1 Tax=Candidatus Nitrotoga fabula TaxID=2182327 RepID=A0A916BGS3_9PROT|nr:hypothetical protein [Candidatus Nitrotoga fabula]CAE6722786.1 conserved hypothetical protein [Candidatus Nitrotoga fabula]